MTGTISDVAFPPLTRPLIPTYVGGGAGNPTPNRRSRHPPAPARCRKHSRREMSSTEVHNPSRDASTGKVDMKLEVQIIPVSDVDRAKQFYDRLGWRLDDDVAPFDGLRIVQFTPPGSGTSITFGIGLTTAAPGSAEAGLIVSDIEAAHHELAGRGLEVSGIWHGPPSPAEARRPGTAPAR